MLDNKVIPEQNNEKDVQDYEEILDEKEEKDKAVRLQDWFDSTIEQHDKFDFEVKMEYDLYKSSPVNNFKVSMYFFTPQSLQINSQNYPRERFYTDMNAHIRFKTPTISLEGILNEKNDLSPFTRIEKYMEDIKNGKCDEEVCNNLITEIRVFGSVLKVTFRDQIRYFIEQMSNDIVSEDNLLTQIDVYLSEIETFQSKIRGFEQQFLLAQIPDQVRDAFNYANQYTSLQITENLIVLLKVYQKVPDASYLCDHIIKVIEKEQKRPHKMKNLLQIQEHGTNESFIYHEGIFKKYLQNVLYLNRLDHDEGSKVLNVFYAIASAVAISFYLAATLFLSLNPSLPWTELILFFSLTVFFYVLREQIKSIIQAIAGKFVRTAFPDKKYDLVDQHEQIIGSVKETMRFLNWKDLSPEILKIRQASNLNIIEQEGKPESVFRFMKDIKLNTLPIAALHDRFGDINDIIRINVRHFIIYADDPDRYVSVWDMKSHEIKDIHCEKVYHLNVVIKLEAKDDSNHDIISYRKVRVVIDQRGIKRVHEVNSNIKS